MGLPLAEYGISLVHVFFLFFFFKWNQGVIIQKQVKVKRSKRGYYTKTSESKKEVKKNIWPEVGVTPKISCCARLFTTHAVRSLVWDPPFIFPGSATIIIRLYQFKSASNVLCQLCAGLCLYGLILYN